MSTCMSEPVEVAGWKYNFAVALVLLPGVIALSVGLIWAILGHFNLSAWSIFLLSFAYWITSIRTVQTNELAGVMVLEQPAFESGPGLLFVPRFICEMDTMPAYTVQEQFPADPEKVSKRDDDLGLREGEFRPIRAITAGAKEAFGDDPLNTRMTLEVTFAVRWRLRQEGFFDMYVKIPGRRWLDKVATIRQHMRDTGETELLEEITERAPFEVVRDMHKLNDDLKSELQNAVQNWGIEIEEARMQAPDFPHELNIELARVGAARARKQTTVTDAEGRKQADILAAEAKKQAAILEGEGKKQATILEGEGIKAAAESIGIPGGDYYAGQIAKETIGEGDVILGAEGIAQVVGLGKHIFGERKGAAR